ncbi:MAG: hypothetical protein LUD19_03320 [Clostridia bacterium]|nr:hypothetical protein [Clostridia bacterium]
MEDYINRTELLAEMKKYKTQHGYLGVLQTNHIIRNVPSADVQKTRHGEWRDVYGDCVSAECTECGSIVEVLEGKETEYPQSQRQEFFEVFKQSYLYCNNCGAKMDGGTK